MLTKEENELIARVGPGTPCGDLLRRYWQPVCAAAELTSERPKKKVRLLGEDLVVFRLADGRYGLVEENCRHRGVSLAYGFCEKEGIRCAYHGWLYDINGRCLEQPFEPKELSFKDRVRLKAYPVEELGGIVFGYMGPPEWRPLLPRWDVLVREEGTREIEIHPILHCNWLQPTENVVDSTHTFFLHTYYKKAMGLTPGRDSDRRSLAWYGFQVFEWGILKSLCFDDDRTMRFYARPLIFPNMLRLGDDMHWRVPIDDVTTRTIRLEFKPSLDGSKVEQPEVPFTYLPSWFNDEGEYNMDSVATQDAMAWETPGPLYDRTKEQLGASDRGIAMFRKMLREQIKIVQDGGDPMALVWEPKKNEMIDLWEYMGTDSGTGPRGQRERSLKPRGRRFEEIFDKDLHEVFEVPFGKARPKPAE